MIRKILIICLAAILSIASSVNAQVLEISNSTIAQDEGTQASIKVVLEPGTKEVKKAFKKWMEDQYDVDVDGIGFLKNKDVLKSKKQTIKSISPKKIDLYARVVEADNKTEMQVYGNLGYDIPIRPLDYPIEYTNMRSLVKNFLKAYLPDYYQEMVEDSQDLVSDLKDDKSDAKNDLQDNREEIEKLKKENMDLVDQIKDYESKLKDAEKALANTKDKKAEVVEKISDNK